MKYGLLEYTTKNVGDEIQSIAAEQFLPRVDEYVKRDHLDAVESEENIKVIMNGWFSHRPENWPPSPDIDPLFISFHISDSAIESYTSPDSISYLRKHEPIGCRDHRTRDLLLEEGVDAYFSGCLTLTLSHEEANHKSGEIFFVDLPSNVQQSVPAKIRKQAIPMTHSYKKPPEQIDKKLIKILGGKRTYLEKFGIDKPYLFVRDLIENNYYSAGTYRDQKFSRAREYLRKYAKADLVITSRLHVSLPCLALGTPVIYVYHDLNDPRLGGLLPYLNAYEDQEFIDAVNRINLLKTTNPKDITEIRNDLIETTQDFLTQ